ncbi:MAG: ABC transporter permease subunit [Xanthobacteraceae bacterium]|jgi:ABC-2 type transport system permease protein
MRREGSPWRGLSVVFFRELFDHLTSARMLVLQLLVIVFGGMVVYFAAEQIRNTTAEDPFLFLRLFAPPGQTLLSFVTVLSILIPLIAIGLGFDSVNGEYNRRTMSRILAQPIYRDALLLGKFLAGLATITICLITLWLMVIGFGLLRLGIPPSTEELARCLMFLLVSIAYAGVWLALAMLFSIVFRSTATAALISLGVWLFLALLWPAFAQLVGEIIAPSDIRFAQLGLPTPDTVAWQQGLSRLSPGTLYGEAVLAMLSPEAQSLTNLLAQFQGRIMGAPLPFGQSVLSAWPQMVSLIAGTILLYVVGYVVFQRQEVRA